MLSWELRAGSWELANEFMKRITSAAIFAVLLATVINLSAQSAAPPAPPTSRHPATAAGAKAFLAEANTELLKLVNAASRAGWTQSTYITPDTETMAAQANEALVNASTRFAKEAFRFDKVQVSPVERRQLYLLKNSLTMSAPPDPKEAEELTRLVASMESVYGSGKYCPLGSPALSARSGQAEKDCLDIEKISEILAESRDAKQLAGHLDGLAHHLGPDEEGLRPVRRAIEQGRARARVQGHRRDVARQVRHAG